MTRDRILVDVAEVSLIGFIVWFFWLVKARGVRAAVASGADQEQMVLVRAGPDFRTPQRRKRRSR